MKKTGNVLLVLFFLLSACQTEKSEPVRAHAKASDFAEAKQVAPQLAKGFDLQLWAPGPLLKNAVALTFDNEGVAYVAETVRRKSSDLDIRAHREWMTDDLSLQTVEDTRAFHMEKMAPENSAQNTWQEDFNQDGSHDYRDLEVQSEYIRRVWDSDGDGKADVSQIFAEGFNDMITGVAAGILYYDDQVFLTAAPDVWRLWDKNKDGVADQREKISHGYGIHIAYAGHDMSGLTMGPDGRIYWAIGDLGANVVDANGKRWAYPNQGVVLRCNPDGSDFEVFAHGVRNPQELAFDAYGNLISVDNDGDHRGEHERYIHIIEGSDTGWRINWQFGKYNQPNEEYKVWMDEKLYLPHFPGQAAYLLPPLKQAFDGPAGLAFNPGTALDERWKDYFFASYFTGSSARSKIQAFKIQPRGASFEIIDEQDILGGIVPTGINFGPDGALYVNDWKDSYDKKPAGRIWKLDTKTSESQALRKETQQLLREGMADKSEADLSTLLAHADQRVRMAAQFELVRRSASASLLAVAQSRDNLLARLHAIWGIGQLARQETEAAAPLTALLKDPETEIRAQTAKVLGDARYQPAFDQLMAQLKDSAPRAQFFAIEALGKLGKKEAFSALVDLLEVIEEKDPHMRHAVIYALSRLKQEKEIAELSEHSSKYVRIGAVVALRMLKSPLVAGFLADSEPLVLAEAARAINDDFSIPEALPALAAALEGTTVQNEPFLRRAINANLRLGDAKSAQRLAAYAQNPNAPEAMRADALWALGYWSDPPVLDRVDGRYRELKGHQLTDSQDALASVFDAMVNGTDADLRAAAVTAAGRLNYQAVEPTIFTLFKDSRQAFAVRDAALKALATMKSSRLIAAIDLALEDSKSELRQSAQDLLAEAKLSESTQVTMLEKILNNSSTAEKQKALASLAKIKASEARTLLKRWLDRLIGKQIEPELQLDVLMAVSNSTFEDLKKQVTDFENTIDSTDMLAQYEATLYGGDAGRGRRIFSRNESAQCQRCHVLQGFGGEVGPPLDHIASKLDRKTLLLSLVEPNARIAPGYGTVILKLKDGKEVAGTLQKETDTSITIKTGSDQEQTIEKEDIQERETLPSGMLNMAELLSREQIRDLMAYLVTLK